MEDDIVNKKMSSECFVCRKKTVIGFDFLAVEKQNTTAEKTAYHEKTLFLERICGIVRLTLCSDCMKSGIKVKIADMKKKNGKPKLFAKKTLMSLNGLLEKYESGDFECTNETEQLFVNAFQCLATIRLGIDGYTSLSDIPADKVTQDLKDLFGKESALRYSQIPEKLRTPIMRRIPNMIIDPPYVLWTPGYAPFQCAIEPKLHTAEGDGNMILFPMKFLFPLIAGSTTDKLSAISNLKSYIEEKTINALPDMVRFYEKELSSI